MSELSSEITAVTQAQEPTENEARVISAYKTAAKIKSATAQKAFLERFLPQMEDQLGLVDFVSSDVKEIIRENPSEATNIVELMKGAQRKMREEIAARRAFQVNEEPQHVGRSDTSPNQPRPGDQSANYRVNAAIRAIRARVKDLDKLRTNPHAIDMLSAILSDDFNDEEIQEVLFFLGVR